MRQSLINHLRLSDRIHIIIIPGNLNKFVSKIWMNLVSMQMFIKTLCYRTVLWWTLELVSLLPHQFPMQFSVDAALGHHGHDLEPSFLSKAHHVTRMQRPVEKVKRIYDWYFILEKSLTCHATPNFDISRPDSPSAILAMSEHTAT